MWLQLRCKLSPLWLVSFQNSKTHTHTTHNWIDAAAQKEWYDGENGKEEKDKRKKEIEWREWLKMMQQMHIGRDLFELFDGNWIGICEWGDAYG